MFGTNGDKLWTNFVICFQRLGHQVHLQAAQVRGQPQVMQVLWGIQASQRQKEGVPSLEVHMLLWHPPSLSTPLLKEGCTTPTKRPMQEEK